MKTKFQDFYMSERRELKLKKKNASWERNLSMFLVPFLS